MTVLQDRRPTIATPSLKSRPASSSKFRRQVNVKLWQVFTVAVTLLIWTLVYWSGTFSEDLLPPVWDVALRFVTLIAYAEFWSALAFTVSNALIGLLCAIIVGIPLGMILGTSPALQRSTQFIIDLGRAFPVIALLPVMVLILGATAQMEIVVVFLGVVWPIMLQTIDGARRVEPVIADTVSAYRIPFKLRFLKVVLPNAAPFAVTGIRIASSASILIALGVEVLSVTPGIGGEISRAQTDGAPALALAYVIYAGIVGFLLNKVLWSVEGRLLAWNRRSVEVGS